MDTVSVKIMALTDSRGNRAEIPAKATPMSAGYDLKAFIENEVTIAPGEIVKIPTGLCFELPENSVGCVFGRSGLGAKFGITLANSVGVIDCDYRGEIIVPLINHSATEYTVKPGDRIAQMVIMPIIPTTLCPADSLSHTRRGAGGFGSSGK